MPCALGAGVLGFGDRGGIVAERDVGNAERPKVAGGYAQVWSGAKRIRRAHEIPPLRVGRTWRLLFRLTEERLEILDLVHRGDLDAAIARLTRA